MFYCLCMYSGKPNTVRGYCRFQDFLDFSYSRQSKTGAKRSLRTWLMRFKSSLLLGEEFLPEWSLPGLSQCIHVLVEVQQALYSGWYSHLGAYSTRPAGLDHPHCYRVLTSLLYNYRKTIFVMFL